MATTGARSMGVPGEAGRASRIADAVLGSGAARRVWPLTLAMAALGLVLTLTALGGAHAQAFTDRSLPWWAFALAVAVVEFPLVHLHVRSDAHSFTLGELALCLGLFLLPPVHFVIGAVVGAGIAKFRRPPVKLAFNASLWGLQAAVAVALFHALGDPASPFGGRTVAVAFGSMAVVGAIGVLAVLGAIALAQGRVPARHAVTAATIAFAVNVANAGLGVVAAYLAINDPQLVLVLVGPVAVMFLAYRAFVVEHQQHQRLQVVYRTTRSILQAPEMGSAIDSILSQAREVFRADIAQIVLYPDRSGESIVVRTAGPGGDAGLASSVSTLEGTVFGPVALTRRTELVTPDEMRLRGCLVGLDPAQVREAIVAPLEGERRILGAIAVANRLGDSAEFDASDLKLLETLASHAGVAIGNGRLERALDELRDVQSELARRATHDALTGLANREHFSVCLASALADADRRPVGLVYVDLDDFKLVNDRHGHAAGDLMLEEVADRLRACLREQDLAGRLGGDEFAVLLRGVSGVDQLSRMAGRIQAAVERPIDTGHLVLEPRVSLGVTLASGDADPESLLSDGDTAMYHAKRSGKSRSAVYDLAMRDAHTTRAQLVSALAVAADAGELVLHYQPIVRIRDRRVVGVEALVRWDRPGWGILEPGAFVPLAEEAGLASTIGDWVLREACGQVSRWNLAGIGPGPLSVAVNVSPEQLAQVGYDRRVTEAVHASGLDPSLLMLEITERVLAGDTLAPFERLESIRACGVKIALDDFGTGLSSLARLGDAPVDLLKIPGGFVPSDAGADAEAPSLADALVTIGKTLGLPTIAETVESAGQIDRLERIGCDFVQGHAFSPAMPAEELERWLMAGDGAERMWAGLARRGTGTAPDQRAPSA